MSFCDHNYNYSSVVEQRCVESERKALLEIKRDLVDPSDRLITWSHSNRDCCSWYGVVCDDLTGHVRAILLSNPYDLYSDEASYEMFEFSGKVSPSLLNLSHLNHLDLSGNYFGGVKIPAFLGSIKSLKTLDLSHAGFEGMIPHQLGNLSNLQYLDIEPDYLYSSYVNSFQWLSHLHSLKYLGMDSVNLSQARDWLQVTSALRSLEELHLSDCNLPNVESLPNTSFSSLTKLDLSANNFDIINLSWVFYLTSLISLDLSANNLQGPIPEGLQNLTSLKYLDLSGNHLNSSIPDWFNNIRYLETLGLQDNFFDSIKLSAINNLTSLGSLDLSYYNVVDEELPVSLGKLCNLKSINLQKCSLSVDMSQFLKNLSICVSNRLESLDLSCNQLHGELSDEIGQFQNLISLDLSNNLLSGPIPFAVTKLSSLEKLHLDKNKFNGSFPILCSKLQELLINDNSLQGEVSEIHFENATKLTKLDMSRNSLNFKVASLWIPPFQLTSLLLQSCNLGSEFPPWIRSQKNLTELDMSSAQLSGSVPPWFWDILPSQIVKVNISHNHFHGHIPNLDVTTSPLWVVDFNSNNFEGILPVLSWVVDHLDLSNNSFSGSISHFLCVQSNRPNHLSNLILKGNNLSGELPDCWERWPNLEIIDLRNNNFVGNIPSSMGSLTSLLYLHLGHNKLSGNLPSSISNCSNIKIIDVGYNQLVGSIPSWIGESLSSLRIVVLHSNKFYNNIPNELCHLISLQILDLANNNLSGSIPQCFGNFTIMVSKNSTSDFSTDIGPLIEDVEIMTKQALYEYSTNLKYMKAIDISSNKLSGELPAELTTLKDLQSLNLSNNQLTGIIPRNIGIMTSLESLDLSSNKLCGEIPSSMSELNFLGALNLSNNKLNGKIPQGTQLQSMNESSFAGNELCGAPLTNNCTSETHDKTSNPEDEKKHQLDWFYASMGAGFIVGFWSSAGSVFLNRSWRIMFFRFVDRIWLQVLLFVAKCKAVNMFRFYK